MRTWYFPLSPGLINDATEYYVRTIERAANELDYALERVDSIRAIPDRAQALVIDCKTAFKLSVLRPRCRFWLWIQGIVPEEAELHFGSKARKLLWTAFERRVIPRARGTFLVSHAMRRHYAQKYGFTSQPSMIMPCVNQELDPGAFDRPSKYAAPTFVYAGSMHEWQCFDLTLDVFRRVRAVRPDARLTVLTGEQEVARCAVREAGFDDVTVTRVPLGHLQQTLADFKYGFVLRRQHVVNSVATPTKTSSYMAAGVIPIMTSAVHDFAERLGGLEHVIMSRTADAEDIAARILDFERRGVTAVRVLEEFGRVFDEYFDHHPYLSKIAAFLADTGFGETAPTVTSASGSLAS
jgi:hypothetical protein